MRVSARLPLSRVSNQPRGTDRNLKLFHQPAQPELIMSALNGDKSRHHRERKQKIARRKRTRELFKHETTQVKAESNTRAPKSVSA